MIRRQEIRLCRIFEVQAELRDARQKQMACISFVPGELVGQTNEGGGNDVLRVNYYVIQAHAYNIQQKVPILSWIIGKE